MQPDDAIERYKERRARDAQAPVGATDFDDLDAMDSGAEESDDDVVSSQARYRRGPMAGFFSSGTLPSRTANAPTAPPPGSRIDDYFDNLGGGGMTLAEQEAEVQRVRSQRNTIDSRNCWP